MTEQNGFWSDGARLAVSVSMQFEAGGQPSATRGQIGLTHLSFHVRDVGAVAAHLVDHGRDPQRALDAPRARWFGGRAVVLEPGFPAGTAEALSGVGLDVAVSWMLPTWLESAVLVAALARLGAVQNPILPLYRDVNAAQP